LALVASSQPLSSGRKTPSRWDARIISASTNQFYMAGKMDMSIFGAGHEIKAMFGL